MKLQQWILIMSLMTLTGMGCGEGGGKMSNTPDYISDDWYLDDKAPQTPDQFLRKNGKVAANELVGYIHRFGTDQDREKLVAIQTEFLQQTLDLARTVQKQRK